MTGETRHELAFIRSLGLGTYGTRSSRVRKKTRKEILEGYLEGAARRRNWGAIDKEVVISAAREACHNYGAKPCMSCRGTGIDRGF